MLLGGAPPELETFKGYCTTAQMTSAMKLQTPPKKGTTERPTMMPWSASCQQITLPKESEDFLRLFL